MLSARLQEVKPNWKIINVHPKKCLCLMLIYKRWSFTRGIDCRTLAGKILVSWIQGAVDCCLWVVQVTYKRCLCLIVFDLEFCFNMILQQK